MYICLTVCQLLHVIRIWDRASLNTFTSNLVIGKQTDVHLHILSNKCIRITKFTSLSALSMHTSELNLIALEFLNEHNCNVCLETTHTNNITLAKH